jgi:hypothetical protein
MNKTKSPIKLQDKLNTPLSNAYKPTTKETQVVSDVCDLFRKTSDERNRRFQFFDGLNLIEYLEDSVQRFTTNVFERDDMEDWQASVNDGFTRNKVLAVLGKIMTVLPIAEFQARGTEDTRKATILTNLYEYFEEQDDYEEFMTHYLLEAIVKGTAIGYEGVTRDERKIRNVKGVGDDITVSEKTETTTSIYASIVPLEEFYPSSPSIRKLKDMPYAFWRKVITYTQFLDEFGAYEQSKVVEAKRTYSDDEHKPYYNDFIGEDVGEGSVELIKFYDRMNDQFVLIANGIWLNPIKVKETQEVSPLPFNHKELPFFECKFDFFGDFFYGKSLPDRLKSLQDVLNVLTNMLLDQSFLTIFPPMLTNGFDSIEDDYLRPGRRTPVDTQGLPITSAFMKLDLGVPSGWHQYILEYTRKIMEEASLDRVSQGQAGVGGRTTAQEIRIAAEGVTSILQLFSRMVNYSLKRKAELKIANILQFGTDRKSPLIQKILGEDAGEQMKAFNIIEVDNTKLTGGKRGVKVIEMYGSKEELPKRANLEARAMLAKAESNKETEIIAITPEYIRDVKYDIKLIPNIKTESTKDVEKALQLEKVRVLMSFFPNQIDMNELAAQTIEKMGEDPAKILKQEILNPVPVGENMEGSQGLGTAPNDNTSNNIVNGEMGGNDPGMQQMQQLTQGITG